jgi:rsbT co-antagonist protein RsbR
MVATQESPSRARLAALLDERGEPEGELRAAVEALCSALAAAEAALVARDEQLAALDEMLTRIGFPVLQVRRGTVCVPLVGEFDGERASRLAELLLTRTVEQRVRTVVLDLTGVVVADAGLAERLSRTIHALRLVGARVLLSGLQPDSAAYFASARIDLQDTRCYIDVASALAAEAEPGARGWT